MSDVWKKLNLTRTSEIVVLEAPPSFEPALKSLSELRILRDLSNTSPLKFLLAFVTHRTEISRIAARLHLEAGGDPVVWFAYPKKSSKRFPCDFSRDSGWEPLGEVGFEAVRQIAIDEDWSALRFRRVEHIGKMTRDPGRTLTAKGRQKVSKGR